MSQYQIFYDYGLPYKDLVSDVNGTQEEKLMKNIEYLYNKMKQCTRNVTYFDLYKLNTIITNASEFQAKVNSLLPFTSAIINAKIVTEEGQSISPGDIILKNYYNSFLPIYAQRGGIFYPQIVRADENASSYDFYFNFRSVAPEKDSITETERNKEATYAETIVFKGLSLPDSKSPYNYVYKNVGDLHDKKIELPEISLAKDTNTNEPI
jgi:hypothetical protein